MAAKKIKRDGNNVMIDGKFYATGKDTVAAATIVDALIRAEGRIPKDDNAN